MTTQRSYVDDFVACLVLVGALLLVAKALGWLAGVI